VQIKLRGVTLQIWSLALDHAHLGDSCAKACISCFC